jgi:hypothetical protein
VRPFVADPGLITPSGGGIPQSLGKALTYLMTTGLNGNRMTKPLGDKYQTDIVKKRNECMHEAGAFPAGTAEVAKLLSDMQSCLSDAISLW